MADIIPFKGWHFYDELLSSKTKARQQLHSDSADHDEKSDLRKSSFPWSEGSIENIASNIQQWKRSRFWIQDHTPSIYPYFQQFTDPLTHTLQQRKGFVCMVKVVPWNHKVILPHENTMPHRVNKQYELLAKSRFNLIPTHGLFTANNKPLMSYLDQSISQPILQNYDHKGVLHTMGQITDPIIIDKFVQALKPKKIILADGHHRFQGSLNYCYRQPHNNSGIAGSNFHMMYLTNTEQENFQIRPIHRLVKDSTFSTVEILQRAKAFFTIETLASQQEIPTSIAGNPWSFGLLLDHQTYNISLKKEVFSKFTQERNAAVRHLDVSVLHYFFLDKVLAMPYEEQASSENIVYDSNFENCLSAFNQKQAKIALLMNGVTLQEIEEICNQNKVMPQKSTYFYPKAIKNFVFGSIDDHEL